MKTWLLSVAATVILTILLELILSEGAVKKYVQGIIRLLLLFVIISPVIKLAKGDLSLEIFNTDTPTVRIDDTSASEIIRTRYDNIEDKIEKDIKKDLSIDVNVDIEGFIRDYSFVVNEVLITIDSSGINYEEEYILIKEKIIAIVKKYLNISEESIFIHGVN